MSFFSRLNSFLLALLRRRGLNAEIEEELRAHVQHRADDLERSGHSRAEAERLARIELGGHEKYRQESHEAARSSYVEIFLQDVRFSFRLLRKSPGFALAAVLTLALAIGANAVVFGVMDGLILRPLDVPQASTLWSIVYEQNPAFQSYPNYRDLRDRNRSFEDLAAFGFTNVGLDAGKNPVRAMGFWTTGNYFDVLGVKPLLGHYYHASDEHGANSAPYLVLNYAYWHSHFQDDRGIVGRTILVNKHPFTVTGVTPPSFQGTLLFASPDFFLPMVNEPELSDASVMEVRGNADMIFEAFGHLKPAVTPTQAIADINAIRAELAKTYPKDMGHDITDIAHPGLTAFHSGARAFVAGLMLLSGLILLAACANLGSLFAARAADRSREVALRLALGSSRSRILRQLLIEAVLVALAGGAIGLTGSIVLLRRLSQWEPFPGAPIHLNVSLDAKIYIFAIALSILSGLLFGIVPVRLVMNANPYEIVKAGLNVRAGHRIALRDVLLVLQIALCAVLVTSSLVAVRGLSRSLHGNYGFEPNNTLLASTDLSMAGYSGPEIPAMQKRMLQVLQTIPGVQHAGLVNNYPPLVYTAGASEGVFREDTKDLNPSSAIATPYRYEVSPEYFAAAGTALLAGRDIGWHDETHAPHVAVVNREMANQLFGSVHAALGRAYKLRDGSRVQIVGVVENGKYKFLTEDQQPAMFLSAQQWPAGASYIVVRSYRDPQELMASMRSKLHDLDSGLPIGIESWNTLLDVVLFPSRIATLSLGVLGVIGAMLSITGIFGMATYSVSKRLRELGIRVALGAQRTEVLQTALGRAFRLLAIGSSAGLILGLLATRVLAHIVYQATPRDPLVLCGTIFAMLLLGLAATCIPAQRALSVDPLHLLREE